MAPAPLSFLPLSPSPSPPNTDMHPAHPMHPSLLYSHSQTAPSSPGFDYTHSSTGSESPPPKRYRSAPPKTFQCAGYGECRMVFSRSEHLARHIRKHTGERPFACHCTKQFSRLDNLRQHAQTVHSAPEDKPLNERMMRALAGVNASMMAGVRGRRRFDAPLPLPLPSPSLSSHSLSSSQSASQYNPNPDAKYEYGQHSPSFPPHYGSPYAHGHSLPPTPSSSSFPTSSSSASSYPPSSSASSSGSASAYPPTPPAYSSSSSAPPSAYGASPPLASAAYGAAGGYFESVAGFEQGLPPFDQALEHPPAPFDHAQPSEYAAGLYTFDLEDGCGGDSPYSSSSGGGGAEICVKQEEVEQEGGIGMEAFYAALHGQPQMQRSASAASMHSAHSHSRQQQQQAHPYYGRAPSTLRGNAPAAIANNNNGSGASNHSSPQSSPAGSPCEGTFWGAAARQHAQLANGGQGQGQGQGQRYLPSPPLSPPYYATSSSGHPSSLSHPSAIPQHAAMHPQEMSNAQYYAALQAQGWASGAQQQGREGGYVYA
ncbi:hypothetical protein C8R44DRAFT_192860 [Mycena epipterygia]|nr:hypothetical protein C8R44DRAFT_192860 [Mycena epipterygia]